MTESKPTRAELEKIVATYGMLMFKAGLYAGEQRPLKERESAHDEARAAWNRVLDAIAAVTS